MSGKIPREFIDDVLARTDIVELIDKKVPLKKKGSAYMACCPFHNEKTPSFSVNQTNQFYKCFGCEAKGNAISFLMDFDQLSFREAIEDLAESAGLELPDTGPAREDDGLMPALLDTLANANRFFKEQLRDRDISQ
ncbi:MAG: DNA primase, partial [Proteobacteria bacterium]|nr:DNA primase [Pseudomonadota bacterium]